MPHWQIIIINFKNCVKSCTFHYFDDITEKESFHFGNFLNVSVYVSYKTVVGISPLRIIYTKMDGFIRDYNGTKYLISFGSEKHDVISDRTT